MQYLFATSNQHKLSELQRVLAVPIEQVQIDLPEVQAIDVQTVVEAKAKAAYDAIKQPVIVEDTGLGFHAWNGLPGALITWFLQSVDVTGICAMLHGFATRKATAETWIGLYDGAEFVSFCGKTDGTITEMPRGTGGFGWDSIFVPDGYSQTFAELAAEQKLTFSMRTEAARQLKDFLENQSRQK